MRRQAMSDATASHNVVSIPPYYRGFTAKWREVPFFMTFCANLKFHAQFCHCKSWSSHFHQNLATHSKQLSVPLRRRHHLSLLFASFLAYHASYHNKSGFFWYCRTVVCYTAQFICVFNASLYEACCCCKQCYTFTLYLPIHFLFSSQEGLLSLHRTSKLCWVLFEYFESSVL